MGAAESDVEVIETVTVDVAVEAEAEDAVEVEADVYVEDDGSLELSFGRRVQHH